MHKCFSYPLKAENKEAFLHPGRLLGRGPQLYRGRRPSSLPHPCERPATPPTAPQERQPGLSQPPPVPCPAVSLRPLWSCPTPAPTLPPAAPGGGKVCVGGGMDGWGGGAARRQRLSTGLARVVTAWLDASQSSCGVRGAVTGCGMVSVIR